jgi:hypothetical protein
MTTLEEATTRELATELRKRKDLVKELLYLVQEAALVTNEGL